MRTTGGIGVLVLLLMISLFASVAFAAEKSDLCPLTEFNPDDPAWALIRVDTTGIGQYHRTYTRIFSYFPDFEKSGPSVYMKKLWDPNCMAWLESYGTRWGVDGKRVWAHVDYVDRFNHRFETADFLLTDVGWERGDDINVFWDCDSVDRCNVVATLYKKKVPVASRIVEIKN